MLKDVYIDVAKVKSSVVFSFYYKWFIVVKWGFCLFKYNSIVLEKWVLIFLGFVDNLNFKIEN